MAPVSSFRPSSPCSHSYIDCSSLAYVSLYSNKSWQCFPRHPSFVASMPGHAFLSSCIGPLPSNPKCTGTLWFESIMFSYPMWSGVNTLKNFYLKVKVGENVAIVYVISDTLKLQLLIAIFTGLAGGVRAESHPFIPYCWDTTTPFKEN